MKTGQEASQLGLASERYRLSYRQLSESAPAPAPVRHGSDHANFFGRKKYRVTKNC